MTTTHLAEVTVVRIYCTEAEHKYQELMRILHDEAKIAGVTAFRAIAGFGRSGKIHTSTLVDVSLDLPIIIEFFDTPAKVEQVLQRLDTLIEPGHLLTWPANVNTAE